MLLENLRREAEKLGGRRSRAMGDLLCDDKGGLRADLKSQLKLLDRARTKRELTLEEEKISAQLQKALDLTETALNQELDDIERDVRG